MRKFFIMSSALSLLATAGLLDQARADDGNPYTPEPQPSTEGSYGPYCSIRPLGALWSCEAPKLTGGGPGNTDNNASTLTPTPPSPPSPPTCDHGDKV